jgi:hypothetical protein
LWRGEILLAPWNQIRSKKHPSLSIPVFQFWHNLWNLSCHIPLGLAPWNQIRSKKCPFPSIPIPQLPPNFLNMIRTMCPPEVLLSPLSDELYANNGGAFLRLFW